MLPVFILAELSLSCKVVAYSEEESLEEAVLQELRGTMSQVKGYMHFLIMFQAFGIYYLVKSNIARVVCLIRVLFWYYW